MLGKYSADRYRRNYPSTTPLEHDLQALGFAFRFKRADGSRLGKGCFDFLATTRDRLVKIDSPNSNSSLDITLQDGWRQHVWEVPIANLGNVSLRETDSIDIMPVLGVLADVTLANNVKFEAAVARFELLDLGVAVSSYLTREGYMMGPELVPKYLFARYGENINAPPSDTKLTHEACRWPG